MDTGVVVALLDGDDAHHVAVRRELDRLQGDDRRFAVSAVTLAELLSGPSPLQRQRAAELVAGLGDRNLIVVDGDVATRAGALRVKKKSLATPDALVAASAEAIDAEVILTTDRKLAKLDRARYIGRSRR